ncbi:MAG: VWA domain-containing protein [Gammaproteobacteria bacterium AqS3]|nr:VWA domain-containing protein [Gammaproteobacteria bacterium AqS3]
MLLNFFNTLRESGVPCSFRELLDLMGALRHRLAFADTEQFYYLSRAILVKDEIHYDKFDRAFDIYFKGMESLDDLINILIPDDWLRAEFQKYLSEEERAKIESLGGLEELIKTFRQRLEEQEKRHKGGSRWVGTEGTSPFGNAGHNPMGIRVGEGGQKKAAKVWNERRYRNLDGSVELGTRNIKLALRRLRKFAREGEADTLNLKGTIESTARNAGLLDIVMQPERRNAIKVLVLFDVGGSMDAYVRICERLFSACRTEFKHMRYLYFHNFVYESLWRDNRRRHRERIDLDEILRTYSADYRIIIVGDAAVAPYEITNPGGSIEHWNEEAGAVWLGRISAAFERMVWLNPTPEEQWDYFNSIAITRHLMQDRMFPLTLDGLDAAMNYLSK